jgi:hypothetical protein
VDASQTARHFTRQQYGWETFCCHQIYAFVVVAVKFGIYTTVEIPLHRGLAEAQNVRYLPVDTLGLAK